MRILLVGHGCAPDMGSEPGITWNWALNLAARHDVWVVTHAHFRPAIERFLERHPQPRLRFAYVGRLGWWDPLRLPSIRGIRLHYWAWQRRVLALAREMDAEHDFDLVQHVSWGTVGLPPLLGRLGKPFVWGPVGGGQTTPLALLPGFGRALPMELLRSLRVWTAPFSPALRRAAREAAAVFAANRETQAVLRRAGARDVPLVVDIGVPPEIFAEPPPPRPVDGPFTVLWAGRIEPRKGLALLLEAARLVEVPGIRFVVAGSGPEEDAMRRRAAALGLGDRVAFLGQTPWRELQSLYRAAHVFLFTSIRDTFGTTALEALAGGAPVICLDHQGVGTHLPESAAVKLPVAGQRAVAAAMARAIEALAADRARLAAMSAAGQRFAEQESWDRRARAMEARYAAILRREAIAPDAARGPAVPAAG